MTATLDLDPGQVDPLLTELRGAPGRVEAALAPAALAGTLDVLEQAVHAAWSGPYAVALAAGTRVETNPALAVVTGGTAGHLTGGATAGDLVLGVEFGGGRRVGQVRAGRRARAHTRRTTAQFPRQTLAATRAIEATTGQAAEALADTVAQAVAP